ncbi:MAG: hypothetical protein ACREIW_05145 [Chthoniobacterales bacterium]
MAAYRGQKRVGLFTREDFIEIFLGQRLDVRAVSQLRIGHDRCGIGVDEDDFVAFRTQSFAGLCARIVEFARLPYDDGAGADDQDFLDVSALWHRLCAFYCPSGAGSLCVQRTSLNL